MAGRAKMSSVGVERSLEIESKIKKRSKLRSILYGSLVVGYCCSWIVIGFLLAVKYLKS